MGDLIFYHINRTYFGVKGDFANNYTGIRGVIQNDLGKRACALVFAKRNRGKLKRSSLEGGNAFQ